MKQFLLLFALSFSFSVAAAGDDTPASVLNAGITVPSNLGMATNISPDKQAATLLFDNALVELPNVVKSRTGAANQTITQTKLFTVNIPYESKLRSESMKLDIRGFASVDSSAQARVVVCAGNVTRVVSLTNKHKAPIILKGKSKEIAAATHGDVEYGDYQDGFTFTLQTHAAKPVCQITVALIVDRDSDVVDSGSALLVVDSIDLEIAKGSKAKLR
ncbi:MAG: hypothetical protein KDA47_10515 [Planctomycetales bacterium]|nr:hypothetical protein [Planctomycetales bacterium]